MAGPAKRGRNRTPRAPTAAEWPAGKNGRKGQCQAVHTQLHYTDTAGGEQGDR